MKIEVKQNHIDRGVQGNNRFCPIALAMKEQCTVAEKVIIGSCAGEIYKKRRWWQFGEAERRSFSLPESAMRFIGNFDVRGAKEVAPFEFNIPDDIC